MDPAALNQPFHARQRVASGARLSSGDGGVDNLRQHHGAPAGMYGHHCVIAGFRLSFCPSTYIHTLVFSSPDFSYWSVPPTHEIGASRLTSNACMFFLSRCCCCQSVQDNGECVRVPVKSWLILGVAGETALHFCRFDYKPRRPEPPPSWWRAGVVPMYVV